MKGGLVCIVFLLPVSLFGQIEKHGAASFTRPFGWGRIEKDDIVLYQQSKPGSRPVHFGQIYIYPTRHGNDSARTNFEEDWRKLVNEALGVNAEPQSVKERKVDGWTVITGYADVDNKGYACRTRVHTATNQNTVMTVVVNAMGAGYINEGDKFLKSIRYEVVGRP